jgi:hypothetical protein
MVTLRSEATERRNEQSAILKTIRGSIVIAVALFIGIAFFSTSKYQPDLKQGDKHIVKEMVQMDNASIVSSSKAFVEENCDLGVEEWHAQEEWQRRAPAFLLIGAKKCGTTSLFQFLRQHPDIANPRKKELLTFIPLRFPHWADPLDYDSKVLVEAARQDMYDNDYPVAKIQSTDSMLSFEATPDYLVYSTYSAKAILCTMPWVKILVILRNPVDRLFSHYNFLKDPKLIGKHSILQVSFETWVQKDIQRLKQYGVIPPGNVTDGYFGSQRENNAWRDYQKIPNGEVFDRPVARSLYAIQLEGWFEALRSIGRDPASSVLIVREEDLKENALGVGNKVFDWLGIRPYSIKSNHSGMVTHYTTPEISKETRKMLEDFFYPYNQRLYKLLGKEWDGMWDWKEEDVVEGADIGKSITDFVRTPAAWLEPKKPFLERFCELGDEKTWWIKDGDENSWQTRAPYFLLIGAKKAGTSSLWRYLIQHPSIVSGGLKELHSFQPDAWFPQWKDPANVGNKVRIDIARKQLYEEAYKAKTIKSNQNLVSFDATPDYLLYSTYAGQAIMCTVPWVKILVSLRNPIDRLFSHYNFIMDDRLMPDWFIKNRQNTTFELWVEREMTKLSSYGVIQDKIPQEDFFSSDEERTAWRNYQRQRSIGERPIARSLYAIQLEDWFTWLREAGRDPSEILFVHEEDLKNDANTVLSRIVKWLDLPPNEFDTTQNTMVTTYTTPEISKETRKMLEDFFYPYNQRLYKLLGKEWDGIWDLPLQPTRL